MKEALTRLGWLFILLFACKASYSQLGPAIKWQKCLGGTKNDQANDVVPTPDGGFIVVGQSSSNDGDVSGHHGSDSTDGWW